jgi:hypothetical protein
MFRGFVYIRQYDNIMKSVDIHQNDHIMMNVNDYKAMDHE